MIQTATPSIQAVIESIEALSAAEKEYLFHILYQRRIADRRQEILQSVQETREALKNGTAKIGSAADLIADVFGDDE
jgi:CHASE3 domain sensor protein